VRKKNPVFTAAFSVFLLTCTILSGRQAEQVEEPEPVQPRSVLGDGVYNNDLRLLIDGRYLPEGSKWDSENGIFWNDTDTFFVIDLGGMFEITGISLQVDGNDDYRIDYSEEGNEYFPAFQIQGTGSRTNPGMDTVSSINGDPQYKEGLAFSPFSARFIKIRAAGGDSRYAVSEVQIFGYLEDPAAGSESRIIRPGGIEASGNFSNNADLIVNGRIPFEGSEWNSEECVYWEDVDVFFEIDLEDVYELTGLLIQVDSNDDYRIEYSVSGEDYVPLIEILRTDGEVTAGMDTMSSLADHPEFVSELEFLPVRARIIRVYALGGAGFSISELQIFGIPGKE